MINSACAFWLATGETHTTMAIESARSFQLHNPGVPTIISTDQQINEDSIIRQDFKNPAYNVSDSIIKRTHLEILKYDKILLLDADTYICEDITSIFDILNMYDIAAMPISPSIERCTDKNSSMLQSIKLAPNSIQIPSCFPEFNTGVIAMRNNELIRQFLDEWEKLYWANAHQQKLNQPSFRVTLYRQKLSIAPISSEFNCRLSRPSFVTGKVAILHGRKHDLKIASDIINKYCCSRLIIPKKHSIKVKTNGIGLNLNRKTFAYRLSLVYQKMKAHFSKVC